MKRSKRELLTLLGVLGFVLAFVSSPAFSGPVEYTFSTTGIRLIDPLLTGLTSVSGSFIYENAAAPTSSAPNGTIVYNAMIDLSGSANGNSFTNPVGVVAVLDEGPGGDLVLMHKGWEGEFNGFTFAGMTLDQVVFSWQEGSDGVVDFLDDQSLPSILPPTVGGALRLTFLDAGGVFHHARFDVAVVPGLPVSTPKLNFQGQLAIVEEDNGSGIYSGVPIGSPFSIEMDLVTSNGFISDGTTATAIFNNGEVVDVDNDVVLDASAAALINSLAGTSLVAGDLIDLIEMIDGEALTSGGGRIKIDVGYILDSLAFENSDDSYYPPNPDDILVTFFGIQEEDAQGEEIYLAFGVFVFDGTINDPSVGGVVADDVFGERAQVTFPPDVLSDPTVVSIDVFPDPLDIPMPTGFAIPASRFVNIDLEPTPTFPLPAPGLTVVLPLVNFMLPGTPVSLFRVDPSTGNLVPALDVAGSPVVGAVDTPDGLSATFAGISTLSTVVGLVESMAVTVDIDIRPHSRRNRVALRKNSIPVAILSSDLFDAQTVDPETVLFGPDGATKRCSFFPLRDVNRDGKLDLVLRFRIRDTGIQCGDTEATLTGETFDGQKFWGSDSIKTVGCGRKKK